MTSVLDAYSIEYNKAYTCHKLWKKQLVSIDEMSNFNCVLIYRIHT